MRYITFQFEGTVGAVDPSVSSTFAAGDQLSGFITFDPATSDLFPGDPSTGGYDAITDAGFSLASYQGTLGPVVGAFDRRIQVDEGNPGPDLYYVSFRVAAAPVNGLQPDLFSISGSDFSGGLFSDDSLPQTPPPLSAFGTLNFSLGFTGGVLTVIPPVGGTITSLTLVPLPAGMLLLLSAVVTMAGFSSRGKASL